ncbi:hypothetical protein GCM10009850_038490 [Nonomuraea monospora]|uniref:Uncharacterized protein n=1 Tax=Nonomuraea monospora TaxID=568818 RepID=A0ABN3CGT3_9ACTN
MPSTYIHVSGALVQELAGRAGARLSEVLAVTILRSAALPRLMRVPRVRGVDDFALKRRVRCLRRGALAEVCW